MKTLLIDAIIGVGFPSLLLWAEAEKAGMASAGGWMRERLERCEESQLQALYQGLREAREEAAAASTPESVIIHAH